MRTQASIPMALRAIGVTLILSLSACDSSEKTPASQIAAKVNAAEISVHQINFLLGRSNANLTPEQAPHARREILDKLIDQQLAVEQALDKKLDRTPEVLMALEAGRREILARAYIDQIVASQTRPTVAEADEYIAKNPQLFAERRLFNIQEIILPATDKVSGSNLRELLNSGKSIDDIAVWLKSKEIKFAGNSATRATEQVPQDLLPKLQGLKDGQGLVLENNEGFTVMRLVASQPAPIPETIARPRVQQFLGNQRAAQAISNELSQLKAKAKIDYQGEFIKKAGLSPAAPDHAAIVVPLSPAAITQAGSVPNDA